MRGSILECGVQGFGVTGVPSFPSPRVLPPRQPPFPPMIDSGLVGGGAARAEDAQGTPTQSHISPSILVYEDNPEKCSNFRGPFNYLMMYWQW